MAGPDSEDLSEEQLRSAAEGDLTVLAVLMLVVSTAFALVNQWLGTMGWTAVALAIASTLTWSVGLWRRSDAIAAFVKIGFGFSGLAAPVVALGGFAFAIAGFSWGWALVAGAAVYFGFSVLGLEIIERAEESGVIKGV